MGSLVASGSSGEGAVQLSHSFLGVKQIVGQCTVPWAGLSMGKLKWAVVARAGALLQGLEGQGYRG